MEWVIVDLETTGLNAKRDKIIEIGAVRIRENGERALFQTLIDPGIPLTETITDLTGITDEMLFGQPLIEEVIDDFIDFMGDAVPLAHNASFDGAFLEPYTGIPKEEWLDTISLCKMAFPMLESYALVNLVEYFGIETSAHHRALADAEATADLFELIERDLKKRIKGSLPHGSIFSVTAIRYTAAILNDSTPIFSRKAIFRPKRPIQRTAMKRRMGKRKNISSIGNSF